MCQPQSPTLSPRNDKFVFYSCDFTSVLQISLFVPFLFNSVPATQLCLTLCDPMDRSTPGFPVHHQLPEFTQTHVH